MASPFEADILQRTLDDHVPELGLGISPTLDAWFTIPAIRSDKAFVLTAIAHGYLAGARSSDRHLRGEEVEAPDLPVGAAAISAETGQIYYDFARDNELGHRGEHAERRATRAALDAGEDPKDLTIGVNLEPCPDCVDWLGGSDIHRIAYGAERRDVEDLDLIKRHDRYAPEIVAAGRAENRFGFDMFRYPDTAVRLACIELFQPFERDTNTEVTTFADPDMARSSRFHTFLMNVDLRLGEQMELEPEDRRPEAAIVVEQFMTTLDHFIKPVN